MFSENNQSTELGCNINNKPSIIPEFINWSFISSVEKYWPRAPFPPLI